MASKLEYLQRYMSAAPADAGDKKLRKKKKKAPSGSTAQSRFRVVDADHEWEQDAPSKDAIEQKWELDAADEERPVVVADGEVIDDVSDLPVYVNAEELLDELHMKSREAAAMTAHVDLSPPRRAKAQASASTSASAAAASGKPRRKYSSDGSPPRKRSTSDAAPPRRRRDTSARRGDRDDSDSKDASPPRRQRPTERQRHRNFSASDDDAPSPRRSQAASVRSSTSKQPCDDDSDVSPVRRGRDRTPRDAASDRHTSKDAESGDASPPRKRRAAAARTSYDDGDDASPPRRRAADVGDAARTADVATTRAKTASPVRAPTESQSARHRRTDSLGRDIPEPTRPASSMSTTRRTSENEARGRAGSDASPPRRDRRGTGKSSSRSRSRSNRRRHRSRSPRRSDRRSRSRRASPTRSRSRSRQRDRRRRSPSRSNSRDRSRLRRSSPVRGSSRRVAESRLDLRTRDERSKRSPSPAKRARRDTDTRTPAAAAAQREASSKDDTAAPAPKSSADDQAPAPARAGLFTATEFAVEHARKQAQNNLLRTADAQALGANAETVYRDKRGRKLDMLNEMVRQQEVLDGKREREAREEYEWGTGKVQKQELASERERMAQIKHAPFARREDDPELEKLRKERVRAFDPIHSKVFQDDALDGTKRSRKKSKKKSAATKPTYAGPPAPPNRFGIQPGYRWDGVVRGTGWEEKLLLRQNKQSAVSEEAYKYAVADM